MSEDLQPDNSQSKGELVPLNQPTSEVAYSGKQLSDLDSIKETMSERIKLAKTPEEMEKYLKLREEIQEQIEKEENAKLERKLLVITETRIIIASIVTVVIGWYLIRDLAPVVAPLLIILGLSKLLGYSSNEVSELLKGLTESYKTIQYVLPKDKSDKTRRKDDGQNRN